jgi:hypothetical protein
MATFSSGVKCFRSFLIRSLRYLNGRTLSPFPTEAGQSNIRWGIVRAQEGQFVVPDLPVTTIIPLEPTLSLWGTTENVIEHGAILKNNVTDINRHLCANSKNYYFANDLRLCF